MKIYCGIKNYCMSFRNIFQNLYFNEKFYSKTILLNSNLAEVYFLKGKSYQKLNLLDKAIQYYSKKLENNPSFIEAFNNREEVLKEKEL